MTLLLAGSCTTTALELDTGDQQIFERAFQNGIAANEGFIRCNNYSAETKGDTLMISLQSATGRDGKLCFDRARHQDNMKLPVDWPRINQFPKWFTVSPDAQYQVIDPEEGISNAAGDALLSGWAISLEAGKTKRMMVIRR